jgi:hypothetical protein
VGELTRLVITSQAAGTWVTAALAVASTAVKDTSAITVTVIEQEQLKK